MRPALLLAAVLLFLLPPSPAQVPSGTAARLEALEKAFRAGILTKAEYRAKKAEILASLQGADEKTKKKLRALEAARAAGILSREEYEAKKAEILAEGGKAPVRAEKGGTALYTDPAGRFHFRYPGDWAPQPFPNGRGVNVKSGDWAFSVLVFPGTASPGKVLGAVFSQVKAQWKEFEELRRGTDEVAGRQAAVVEFRGMNPKKRRSLSRLAAFAVGGDTYLLIFSAPLGKRAEPPGVWKALTDGFRLGGKEPEPRGGRGTGRRGRVFKHPIGFTFWYPRGWRVLENRDGGLRLIPPGDRPDDPNPGRFVFILGDSVAGQGIREASDPRVGAFLDRAVGSMLPLRRTGAVKAAGAARKGGAEYNWSGKNLQGRTVLARAFASIIGDFGVALVLVGFEEKVKALDGEARRIFASFGFGGGTRDPRLAGTWRLVSTADLWNGNPLVKGSERARGYHKSESVLELGSDGTWTRTTVTETLVMGAGTSLSSGPRKSVERGKWRAGGGVLYLMGEDQTWEDYRYTLEKGKGGGLLVLRGEKTKEIWRRR